jgi:hypothetical protein
MELRSRTRLQLRSVAMTAALGALLVPATAGAATKKKLPVITKVAPKSVAVGDNLTIYGKNFRKGKAKNRVLFKGAGRKTIFVKAGLSTSKKLTLAVPKSLEKYMTVRDGKPVATRFRIRVLSTRLSKSYTSMGRSPVIGPEKPKTDDGGGGVAFDPNADSDGDGLTNGFEVGVLTTDPGKADTDADGVSDGFEYGSAVDLNNDDYRNPTSALPYPGKRPYPNPLDGADAGTDFDGDSLTLSEEYALWKYTIAHGASPSLSSLTYSDGLQYSVYGRDAQGRRIPALPAANYDKFNAFMAAVNAAGYASVTLPDDPTHTWGLLDVDRLNGTTVDEQQLYDRNGNGWLSDDERDEDGDGLTNYMEAHGFAQPGYWAAKYNREAAFHIAYMGTSLVDPDSDGDGLIDGADDQDHDDYPNIVELSRIAITWSHGHSIDPKDLVVASGDPSPSFGRVNPFNPCLPYTDSRTCPMYIPFGGAWAPFDGPPWDSNGSDPNYLVLQ